MEDHGNPSDFHLFIDQALWTLDSGTSARLVLIQVHVLILLYEQMMCVMRAGPQPIEAERPLEVTCRLVSHGHSGGFDKEVDWPRRPKTKRTVTESSPRQHKTDKNRPGGLQWRQRFGPAGRRRLARLEAGPGKQRGALLLSLIFSPNGK